jgi:hypothetical protein
VAEQSLRSSPQFGPSPSMMSLRSRSIMEWWVTFDRGSYPAKYWYVAFTPNACEPSNTATSGTREGVGTRLHVSDDGGGVFLWCGEGWLSVWSLATCVCAPRCERVRSTKQHLLAFQTFFGVCRLRTDGGSENKTHAKIRFFVFCYIQTDIHLCFARIRLPREGKF